MNDWLIYTGKREPHDDIERLPAPPSWREFGGKPVLPPPAAADESLQRRLGDLRKAHTYRAGPEEVDLVNAALYLRRPLLVTGNPGTGKSTLAYSVAWELKLGRVLKWPVTSRTSRDDGLYQYDALARLQDAGHRNGRRTPGELRSRAAAPFPAPQPVASPELNPQEDEESSDEYSDLGRYIRLGPLGTALLPYERPRVLLIDELDKSDIDLPNDLLNVFEDGQYEIRELTRIADRLPEARVLTDDGDRVVIEGGRVECNAFPLVVITSNGERVFPPAFLRRCLRLHIDAPKKDRLQEIVQAHLGADDEERTRDMIGKFISRRDEGELATDQLLNAIYLMYNQAWPNGPEKLVDKVLHYISQNFE
jgi:MoxR-like ATPase